jgi:HEPN domain-containing protein
MASPEARRLLDPDVEEASWGWAAQQCLEKTLKAWLHTEDVQPPGTHDITDLLPLRAFTSFAVEYRYDDEPEDLSLNRHDWCNRAEALIAQVQI